MPCDACVVNAKEVDNALEVTKKLRNMQDLNLQQIFTQSISARCATELSTADLLALRVRTAKEIKAVQPTATSH